jgi:hypothetical protein
MKYRSNQFSQGPDVRKVKAVLNRTILVCRKAKLFDLARKVVKAKNYLVRG